MIDPRENCDELHAGELMMVSGRSFDGSKAI